MSGDGGAKGGDRRVLICGAGTIGFGWAMTFAQAGWHVTLFDEFEGAAEKCAQKVRDRLSAEGDGDSVPDRISAPDDGAIPDGAVAIAIEAVPEILTVKKNLLRAMAARLPAGTLIVSSTSALRTSALAEGLDDPARFVVAHPFNPSYLIPLVEIVPGDATAPQSVEQVRAIVAGVGMKPVILENEVDGFVANRLQAALINEAMSLLADGVASVDDIDTCISDGLGLRWAFFGPFATMDMNAPDGIADYAAKFGGSYAELGAKLQVARPWSESAIERLRAHFERCEAPRPERQARRDALIAQLRALKASQQ